MTEEVKNEKVLVEIQCVNGEDKPVTTSLKVAEYFDKNHFDVMRGIKETLSKCSESFGASNFAVSSYISEQGKTLPMYVLTRDGFTMVAMGYTGEKAMKFKETYIAEFNRMEAALARRHPVPQTFAEALRAYADEVERRELAEQQRDYYRKTKAEIGSRREATAMGTASAATKRANNWKRSAGELADVAESQRDTIDELNDTLGQGNMWRTVKAIKWLPEIFITRAKNADERKLVRGMYSSLGTRLGKLGRSMGLPPVEIPDIEHGTVLKHRVEVIEHFYNQLLADPQLMSKYRID